MKPPFSYGFFHVIQTSTPSRNGRAFRGRLRGAGEGFRDAHGALADGGL